MQRLSALIWMLVLVGAAFLLYMVKYQVQALRVQVTETEKQLNDERQQLHVMAAEWAYLNRPQRLQSLASKYLTSSSPATADQIGEIEAIPLASKQQAGAATEGAKLHPVSYKPAAGGEE